MKFTGDNLEEVLKAHQRWIDTGGENDDDRADFEGVAVGSLPLAHRNLYGANFRNAVIPMSDLNHTNLQKADLTGVDIHGSCLYAADLRGAINPPFIPLECPDTGSFIAWKRCKSKFFDGDNCYDNSVIVKLLIPEDARRTSTLDRECRADKAVVLEIQSLDGEVLHDTVAYSIYNRGATKYVPGETVIAEHYTEERFVHHTQGIFFYINRQEAVEYLTLGYVEGGPLLMDTPAFEEELNRKNSWDVVGRPYGYTEPNKESDTP